MSRRRERDRVRRKRAQAEIQESVTVIETIISEIIKCILMCTGILAFILVFSILMAFSNIITLVNQNSIWAMIWSKFMKVFILVVCSMSVKTRKARLLHKNQQLLIYFDQTMVMFILVFSILMAFSNIITLVNQNSIWAMIWSVANFVAFLGVVFGLSKNVLIPAIVLCPIAVTIGCINVIVNFVTLSIFG